MPSSHFLLLHVFGQIVELDKKRNTNREALRALKREGASGLKSTYCMFGQSIKFPLACLIYMFSGRSKKNAFTVEIW